MAVPRPGGTDMSVLQIFSGFYIKNMAARAQLLEIIDLSATLHLGYCLPTSIAARNSACMAHALLCRAKELDLLAFSPHALVNSSLEDYCSTSGPDCSFPNADVQGHIQ
nr:uncharacterized protein LOC127294355 isoform X2 [Lolium perenne]